MKTSKEISEFADKMYVRHRNDVQKICTEIVQSAKAEGFDTIDRVMLNHWFLTMVGFEQSNANIKAGR